MAGRSGGGVEKGEEDDLEFEELPLHLTSTQPQMGPPPSTSNSQRGEEEDLESGDHRPLLPGGGNGKSSGSGGAASMQDAAYCWNIAYYRPYFEVTTSQILSRLWKPFWPPSGGSFYRDVCQKVELYGPSWVCTTLILLMGMTGNLASYIHFVNNQSEDKEWAYDMFQVTFACLLIYGYSIFVPLFLWMLSRCMGSNIQFLPLLSLIAYSMVPFVPVAVLCIIPVELVRWTIVFTAAGFSLWFVLANMMTQWREELGQSRWMIPGVLVAGTHFLLALTLKLGFFHYSL